MLVKEVLNIRHEISKSIMAMFTTLQLLTV